MIWNWFAAAESHNRLSQDQAGIMENPGLSYGLLHTVAESVLGWGVVRKMAFRGVTINLASIPIWIYIMDQWQPLLYKWIIYNRLRGQHMSALEHAIPERFFNDPATCNLQETTTPTAGLPACPQGISAVRALGIAATQRQRIYTITQRVYNDNPGIVNNELSAHSYETKSRIQQALDAGYEVTIHERPITQSGWTGAGFVTIDPNTGAGSYTIEGGGNGGFLGFINANGSWMSLLALLIGALPFAYAFGVSTAITIVLAEIGLITYMKGLSGGPCDKMALPIYFSLLSC
ncbi:hypothetical protein [Verminephrobacter eiseniae]|nr:hypothetical protein [Verminephrobacter eiseniae]